MPTAFAAQSRNPGSRQDGGFDRWVPEARDGWMILWRGSPNPRLALGDGGTVWRWDQAERIWNRLSPSEEAVILHEHTQVVHRLRRAILVVRLLTSKLPAERAAARAALQRIAVAITDIWQSRPSTSGSPGVADWFDHPAAVYRAVTLDCRYHLPERERTAFNPRVFAALIVTAYEDFRLGRRPHPPRLRPEDLALLQSSAPRSHAPAFADQDEPAADDLTAGEAADTGALQPAFADAAPAGEYQTDAAPGRPPRPEAEYIRGLREAAANTFADEDIRYIARRERLRKLVMVSGSLAAGLATIATVVSVL